MPRLYALKQDEKKRLVRAMEACLAIPFVDDIVDFSWEAIFQYCKGLPIVDPLLQTRSKKLFDAVDPKTRTGWSLKALQWRFEAGKPFELVIQRADIFKKAKALGFEKLNLDSPPRILGRALIKHWGEKVTTDAAAQGVVDSRVAVLLKSLDRRKFALAEADLRLFEPAELEWAWTNSDRQGLQGREIATGTLVYRWYPGQKQFFESFPLTRAAYFFSIDARRLEVEEVLSRIHELVTRGSGGSTRQTPP